MWDLKPKKVSKLFTDVPLLGYHISIRAKLGSREAEDRLQCPLSEPADTRGLEATRNLNTVSTSKQLGYRAAELASAAY